MNSKEVIAYLFGISFFMISLALLALAVERDHAAFRARQAYEEIRADNESLYRTIGRGVNPAFNCRANAQR